MNLRWARINAFLLAVLLSILLIGCASVQKSPGEKTWMEVPLPPDTTRPELTIVYPRGDAPDTVLAETDTVLYQSLPDSMFLFGSVSDPSGTLIINNVNIPVHPEGGWIAWIESPEPVDIPPEPPRSPSTRQTVTIEYSIPSNERVITRDIQFIDKMKDRWAGSSKLIADTVRLRVSSDKAKIRTGWPGTYDMFPPEGVLLWAVGRKGGNRLLWKVPLGGGMVGWIEDEYVEVVEVTRAPVPAQTVYSVVCESEGRKTRVHIPLRTKIPFRIERVDDNRLELTVFGAVSWTDLIIQPVESKSVDEVRWSQVDSTTYKLTAFIDPNWFWGWTAEYDDRKLVWTINTAPEIAESPLQGIHVAIDPGHGGMDYSAIGPTGLPEKTANLWLAQDLAYELENAGAVVFMTRAADTTLGLVERVKLACENDADLLLSLHHNATGQGVNPAFSRGTSVHYNHRHALPLAVALYQAITSHGQPGNGVRYQDLALARPSFAPAVLIEAGYMMQPDEETLMKRKQWREDMARWIRAGLEEYLGDVRMKQRWGD